MKRYLGLLVVLLALLVMAACNTATTPEASLVPELTVTADLPADNSSQTCPNTGEGDPAWTKIDRQSGSASGAFGSFSYSGNTLVYDLNDGYTLQFCIKSGVQVGTIYREVSGSGSIIIAQAISHISWRIVDEPPVVELQNLTVTKGADASYDRTVEWDLTKTVNGVIELYLTGAPGSTHPLEWVITATKDETLDNYFIEGEIGIGNPNPIPVTVDVTDELDVDVDVYISCTFDEVTEEYVDYVVGTVEVEVAAGGSVECHYYANPEDDSATLNTATVDNVRYDPPENSEGTILGDVATAVIDFVENLIGYDEGDLFDPEFMEEAETISETTELEFEDTWVCSEDAADYDENGEYCQELLNTATLTFTEDDYLEATAYVKLTCKGLYGCTPGFWKQTHHFGHWAPTGYSPTDLVGATFGPSSYGAATLAAALDLGGGGGVLGAQRNLLRAAVASLLNFAHPDVNYAVPGLPEITNASDLIDAVNAALASGDRQTMLALATMLDDANNAVNLCALDGQSFLD